MLTLGSGVLKAKAWTAGGYYGGQVDSTTVTLTSASTGGSLSNGTYYVQVMAKNLITGSNYAEGEPSAEKTITLSGGVPKTLTTYTRTATDATITSTAHGFSIGTIVVISGSSVTDFNSTFTVTAVTTNTFTFTIAGTVGSGSSAGTATASTQKITVAWTNVSGAEAYDIYVGNASGQCFRQVVNTTTNTGYQITAALVQTDQRASDRGLITIGEIGGDVEYNLEYQEKEFYGQANFAIAKYFYGGKSSIAVKKLEINPILLVRLMGLTLAPYYDSAQSRWEDRIDPSINISLKPLYLEFTHTRSDVSGTVKVIASKACLYKLPLPFTREDIATMDLDFTLQYDSTVDNLVSVIVA
jgi:hypothetical protein